MLSQDVQQQILEKGRRVGTVGLNPTNVDTSVFNPDWGIDVARVISPITVPSPDVIREALTLYQTTLRKPSFTIYCLDFSGSMAGNGESQVKSAMRALLDQQQASQYFLQATPRDVSVVIRFNDGLYPDLHVAGITRPSFQTC